MKIITANKLGDGAVVYLGDDDGWTLNVDDAARFQDDEIDPVLQAVSSRTSEIADAYAISVNNDGALQGRETLRETIRSAGPTVRLDLGIQAGAGQ